MATVDELEKEIEQLRQQIDSLQDGFNKFQKLLVDVVETQQLKVAGIAQIAGRDINETFVTLEQRLNSHDSALSSHDVNISAAQSTANDAASRANNAQVAADNAQTTANDAVNKANKAQTTANDAVNKANAAQSTANKAQTTANDAVNKANAAQSTANSKIQNARIGIYGSAQPPGNLPGGWVRIGGDLNKGAGGDFIFLEIKR